MHFLGFACRAHGDVQPSLLKSGSGGGHTPCSPSRLLHPAVPKIWQLWGVGCGVWGVGCGLWGCGDESCGVWAVGCWSVGQWG